MSNSNLAQARKAKNDEFYTQYNDVEAEMTAYYEYNHEIFRNKIILCPCDDPEWSSFVTFFATNFKKFGLKALISTSYANSGMSDRLTDKEKDSPYYDEKKHKTRGKLFVMTGDMNGDSKIDSDDVSFQKYLQGNGDFRSDEVTKLRDEADIIITNPPFSLFREFLNWIMEGKKQFIILGNMNAVTYKEVFPLVKENKMWMGYRSLNRDMYFDVTQTYQQWLVNNKKEGSAYKIVGGNIMGRLANACWFTNIEHGKRHEKMILDTMINNLRFNKSLKKKLAKYGDDKHFTKYDNYDAIEIPIIKCIPSDYSETMGVPITFLDKFNPEQFEIIGELISGASNKYDFAKPTINGKKVYARILIKHKDSI